jgi:predicted nucleic acid-binding protein
MIIDPSQVSKSRIVVDTDVFSYLWKKDTRGEYFQPYLLNRTLALSFMSVAELYFGAYHDHWGPTRLAELENAMKNYVVLPYEYAMCQIWARVRCEQNARGNDMKLGDLWIAATALKHDCALATNNRKDFEGIAGLELIAPALLDSLPPRAKP